MNPTANQSPAPVVAEKANGASFQVGLGQRQHNRVNVQGIAGNRIGFYCGLAACVLVSVQCFAETPASVKGEVVKNQVLLAAPVNECPAKILAAGKGQVIPLPALIPAQSVAITQPEGSKTATQCEVGPKPRWYQHPFPFELYFYVTCPIFAFLLGYFIKNEF